MLFFFFFNDTATTEIYTLSLHDALPISFVDSGDGALGFVLDALGGVVDEYARDRKSTRLNSSHSQISYAVFCLKKKNNITLILEHPRCLDTDVHIPLCKLYL